MHTFSQKITLGFRVLGVVAAYAAACLLLFQAGNRYAWMRSRGVEQLPQDLDSPGRVWLLVAWIGLSSALALALQLRARMRREPASRFAWLSVIPLAYALWRALSLLLLGV